MERKTEDIFDEWLVLEFKAGNVKAITLLAKRWYPKILRQAYRHTRDTEAAKDVAQESWIAITKGIHKIRDPSRGLVWATAIASRKAIDWIRNTQRVRNRQELNKEIQQSFEEEESLPDEDTMQQLRFLIRQLPEKQQIVLSMFYLESYPVHDIAEILNISEGTVKSRLFHAREKLKTQLKNIVL